MGIITGTIGVIVVILFATGAYVYFYPEQAKTLAIKGLNRYAPEIINIDLDEVIEDFKEQLPDEVEELIDKDFEFEKDYNIDEPFNYKNTPDEQITILGRPKKIVEFLCTQDTQCMKYFKNMFAKCEPNSGMCYVGD